MSHFSPAVMRHMRPRPRIVKMTGRQMTFYTSSKQIPTFEASRCQALPQAGRTPRTNTPWVYFPVPRIFSTLAEGSAPSAIISEHVHYCLISMWKWIPFGWYVFCF
ncbi:hypothetical protein DQ04_07361020 [Trypanosoma grayi]|uniref:hypothetical protein n=1 Tax=Trypanosoma grayi TaxID=71804 RepID=UPI0004F45E4B|nr:hypothetical protein DQ04_07361020 [Trypanosoma grayi]KEG08365.1 hypothetical protein DQ04_07361020 [Trypanosoma grayi]